MAKKIIAIAIIVFLVLGMASSFVFGEELSTNDYSQIIVNDEESCKEFARLYIEGKSFDTLYGIYDEVKGMHMPKAYFSNQLKKMEHITGKFVSFGKYKLVKNENSDVHVLYLNMEHKQVVMMLTMAAPHREKVNKGIYSKIHGLQFAIVDGDSSNFDFENNTSVEVSKKLEYAEKDLRIGSNSYLLGAKITYPKAEGKYPAVVLVQGEGPFDMDYTIDNTAIFENIAAYLAKNGIISIRYNKREFEYSDIITDKAITPEETVIDDAFSAYNALLKENNIDINNVYILSHGYSSYYVPSLLNKIEGNPAGLIYLSGSPLPMIKIKNIQLANQFKSFSGDELFDAIIEHIDDFKKINEIDSMSDVESKNIEFFGRTAYYYRHSYNNDDILAKKDLPMLILQGSNDEEIPVEYGIELWDKKLYGNKKAVRKMYSGLDHLLVEDDSDKVCDEVLNDIAVWIKHDKAE